MGSLQRETTMRRREKAINTFSVQSRGRTADLGILVLRLGAGGLLAGHGAQKLFGSFGGPGLTGTAGWLESMGLRPGKAWAGLAGISELGGGALMALGLGGPIGPIALQGAMATATRQGHRGKPIWAASGGAELPVVFATSGVALALTGPGRYSLDRALGLRVRPLVAGLVAAGVVAGTAAAESQTAKARAAQGSSPESTDAPPADDAIASAGSDTGARDVLLEGSFVSAEIASLDDAAPLLEDVVLVDGDDAAADELARG